jgi:hypothetical protein
VKATPPRPRPGRHATPPARPAFDDAETQKVPVAEVIDDIEIQLSLDLLPNR